MPSSEEKQQNKMKVEAEAEEVVLDQDAIDKEFEEKEIKSKVLQRKKALEKKILKCQSNLQKGLKQLFYGLILETIFVSYLCRSISRIFDFDGELLTPFGYIDQLILVFVRLVAMMQTYREEKRVYVCGQMIWFFYIILCMAKFLQNLFSPNWISLIGWIEFCPLAFYGTYEFLGCLAIDTALTETERSEKDLSEIDDWKKIGRLERDDIELQDEVSLSDIFWLVWEYSKAHKSWIFCHFIASNLNYGSRAFAPFLMSQALNRLTEEGVLDYKLFALSFICGCFGQGIGRGSEWWFMLGLDWRLCNDFQIRLYEHMLNLEVGFFDTRSSGELNAMITKNMNSLAHRVAWGARMYEEIFITFFWTIIFALQIDVRLTIATFVGMPLIIWLSATVGTLQFHERRTLSEVTRDIPKYMSEGISNIRVVKQFRAEEYEKKLYRDAVQNSAEAEIRCQYYDSLWLGCLFGCPTALECIITLMGCRLVHQGHLSVGNVVAFISYNNIMAWMFNLGGAEYVNMIQSIGEAYKCFQVLKRENALPFSNIHDGSEIEGNLEMKDVHFSYPKACDRKIINGMSIKINAGEVVALVGESGGGKSTIVKLFTRLFDPQQGEVLVDGKKLEDYEPKSLFQNIAVVPQDPELFGRTVRDNIIYGLTREVSEEEIHNAAKLAQIHDFIMDLENGYATEIGERGVTLSGGQKQRVSIARAIIRDPQVLFLDEATASLDSESEHLVHKAIDEIMDRKKITSIIIAHRLSTVMGADRILVLVKGQVIEEGTHESLMALGGEYSKLVERQRLVRKKEDKEIEDDAKEMEESEEIPKIFDKENKGEALTPVSSISFAKPINLTTETIKEIQNILKQKNIDVNFTLETEDKKKKKIEDLR